MPHRRDNSIVQHSSTLRFEAPFRHDYKFGIEALLETNIRSLFLLAEGILLIPMSFLKVFTLLVVSAAVTVLTSLKYPFYDDHIMRRLSGLGQKMTGTMMP